ncbi:hypothetical protein [Oceanobacillus sp. FSL H7-0719]|uniref:hypothetical protein n=1 Tax=Oceanobacillus sp. FSL H7-0719 TaxID=2954507 RepID=UPI0032438416
MYLDDWRKEIDEHYTLLQASLKNIKQSQLYRNIQKAIATSDKQEDRNLGIKLNDLLEDHYSISDIYKQLKWLHSERISWLQEYLGTDTKNNDYYHHMAFNFIHYGIITSELQELIAHNSERQLSRAILSK